MNHAKAIGQRNGRWAGGVGMAVGAAFAAALIGLVNAPVASADEGSAVDTAVDNFLQGIANVFPPEVPPYEGVFGDGDATCLILFECTEAPGDPLIDSLYLAVNTAFQPEGSIDGFFDQLLGGLSVPAADPAQALDIQVSIDGTDLFPTAGNTATATSTTGLGDIAIAIGNGANATVSGGSIFDFAFADGTNSVASVENAFGPELGQPNIFDIAFVLGTGSTATISGEGENFVPEPSNFDVAGVFGDMLNASVTNASGLVDILTPFGTL